jgi:hypothetical protein
MAKFKTKGLIAKIGTVNPPITAIVQLGDSTLDLGERDALINATTHDTSTGTHAFLDPGFKSPASFSGEILYDPADTVHEVVRAAHAAGTTLYLLITLPDTGAAEFLFPCRVRNLSLPLPVMGKLMMNIDCEGLEGTTFTA